VLLASEVSSYKCKPQEAKIDDSSKPCECSFGDFFGDCSLVIP
jgi:hypothetical protein